jgi:hypothetical protein
VPEPALTSVRAFLLPGTRHKEGHREELAYGCMVLQLEALRNGLSGSLVSRYWLYVQTLKR